MATQKIALQTVEEFMAGYVPVYNPIYPLFLSKSQGYAAEVGRLDFRRVEAVGDIRAKHITPKDTEMRQVAAMASKKSFKKYFLANQYVTSQVQDREGLTEVVSQVLDEHQLQADELFLLGEGTSNSDVVNNGLFYSADSNYLLDSGATIAVDMGGGERLSSLHAAFAATAYKADQVAGRKVMIAYGDTLIPYFQGVYPSSSRGFRAVLEEVLGPNWSLVVLPQAATPAGANGWIAANMDQCKLHYTWLPQLLGQGFNEEKMYYWSNFAHGSMMLEVLARNGVIRQPATFS